MDTICTDVFDVCCDFLLHTELLKLSQTSNIINTFVKSYLKKIHRTTPDMYTYFCTTIYNNLVSNYFLLSKCNYIYFKTNDFIRSMSRRYEKLPNGIYYHSKCITTKPFSVRHTLFTGLNYNQYLIIYKNNTNIKICCYKKQYENFSNGTITTFLDTFTTDNEKYCELFKNLLLLRIY